jgi:galactose mutarotase-like enzyme
LFENGVIILEDLEKKEITIGSDKNSHSVSMSFEDFPYIAIWSKIEGAPFICIEPWFGLPDLVGSAGELKNKKGIKKLKNHEIFNCSHEITIN